MSFNIVEDANKYKELDNALKMALMDYHRARSQEKRDRLAKLISKLDKELDILKNNK
jgi:hypothetical protein